MKEYITLNTDEYRFLPWENRIVHLKNRFGFSTLEIGFGDIKDDNEFYDVKRFLEEHNIKTAAGHEWFHFFGSNDKNIKNEMEKKFLRNIERTRELDADILIWYTGDNEALAEEEAVEDLKLRLKPLLNKAEELGVHLLLETEFSPMGTDPGTKVKWIKKLMEDMDHPFLGVNYDIANVYVAGEEAFPYAYLELKPWIKHVHLKDVVLENPSIHTKEYVETFGQFGHGRTGLCCPIGEGAVNMIGLLKQLEKDSYNGFLSMETHIPDDESDSTVEKGLKFIQNHYTRI